jgi:hypothetical protein
MPVYPSASVCNDLCGHPTTGILTTCSAHWLGNGMIDVHCSTLCGIGRRPPGLDEAAGGTDLRTYFGAMAQLEAASVDAFRILRRELSRHGLPRKLERAMRRAARDEIRHTRAARALERHYGGDSGPPRVRAVPARTIEQIAVDNAVEGCVRETYGALVAAYQARTARDARVRAAMTRIARDEIRHAALSWQLDAWMATRLDRAARNRVAEARRNARAELAASIAREPPRDGAELAGLPPPHAARALFSNLTRALDRA